MKKTILTLAIIAMSLPNIAQTGGAAYQIGVRQIDLDQNREFLNLSDAEYKTTEGTPYANKEFILGNIFRGEELVQKNVLLRYNIFSDEIEIKTSPDDVQYGAIIKSSNIMVKIFNDTYIMVPFEGSDAKGGYFKVVSTGKYFDLYKKSTVTYTPRTFPKTSYDRERPASFTQTDAYFLVSKDGKFVEMPDSKSKLLKVMKNKEDEIKAFMKTNRTNFKTEEDLIKLVKYYNNLL
ncbi:hypothetical protein ATE92_1426 [Ulvibacter sp. MAR_2010_11]|uniref:hypothetical protein n=1 Tax=Ulvibacter sp. MAR_2010_11 TaxID=1250229 RepID=UPI000C2C0310|nr:hypothetical protein [Ulvibacter sp. MAR_2010_11]PKA83276.1 hypothetical protein ATE92_1426 [Ulvibacter sp. MAR_2010_11]